MTEVKICGIRDPAAMDAASAAGADWVGFVFFPPSPRSLAPREAAALVARHPNGPQPIALLVEPTDQQVAELLDVVPLAALQVHASAIRAADIQRRFKLPVWHGVGVDGPGDLPHDAPGIARLLLDRKPATGGELPGGNATSFDWSVLREWRAPAPWVLAGGLTPTTVADAVRRTGATAVDVSSGVERERGVKDPALIAAFVAAVRLAS